MGKWADLLSKRVMLQQPPSEATIKTYVTRPAHNEKYGFDGFDSKSSRVRCEDSIESEMVVERASIMEHDGGLSRDRANMAASRLYDQTRQELQGNPSTAKSLYEEYIREWQAKCPGDLPTRPPNFPGNTELWRAWWNSMENQ